MHTIVDREKIQTPVIQLSDEAAAQLKLIQENDFTLAGKYFRLLVSGKGCDGFTYSSGFTDLEKDDMLVEVKDRNNLTIIIDPFTAFYLQNAEVTYVQDFENDAEGFVIKNNDQEEFAGKFWRQDEQKVPPLTTTNSGSI